MEELIRLSERIVADDMACEDNCYISLRRPKGMAITRGGADVTHLMDDDIVGVDRSDNVSKEHATHLAIYQAYPHVKVIMHLKPLFALAASRMNIAPRASTESHAEVIGRKIVTSTTVPERVVEMLAKRREILLMNSGMLVLGYSIDECYERALRIENAIFTYMAAKLIGKRASARKIPCDKIYKAYLANIDKEDLHKGCAIRMNFDKVEGAIVNKDEDNCYIFAILPKYIALFAHADIDIPGVDSIEYNDLTSAKYCKEVARLANNKSKVLLRGRGILVCDDEQWASDQHAEQAEAAAKLYFHEKVAADYGKAIEEPIDIVRMYAQKFNIKQSM